MKFSAGSVKQNVFASIYSKTRMNIVNNGKKKIRIKVGRFGTDTNEN